MTAEVQRLARLIAERINASAADLGAAFAAPSEPYTNVGVIDDLLPGVEIEDISAPQSFNDFIKINSLAERKTVTANLSVLSARVESLVLAFSSPAVAAAISAATGIENLASDEQLYNGGLTVMRRGDFMSPHLDHTHNQYGTGTREIVGLYYLSDVDPEFGGQLGLWSSDRDVPPRLIECRRNRFVLLRISDTAWHSVEPLTGPQPRLSITTPYYAPVADAGRVRLTRFRARPDAKLQDVRLELGFAIRSVGARMGLRRILPSRHTHRATS